MSLEIGDKKRWCPGLVMKPTNHELDMKHKSIIMVKSFKDGKMYVLIFKLMSYLLCGQKLNGFIIKKVS